MKYLMLLILLISIPTYGQLQLNKDKSSLKITGTSSLHDWEMVVEEFDVSGMISDALIQNLSVTVKAKSMKSGKSVMDGKAYDAVQADEYPHIIFSAETLQIVNDQISGLGKLEIAGRSSEFDISPMIINDLDGKMQLKGQVSLKMTDYDIKPPTAMFGTLKTGDEVVIQYEFFLTK